MYFIFISIVSFLVTNANGNMKGKSDVRVRIYSQDHPFSQPSRGQKYYQNLPEQSDQNPPGQFDQNLSEQFNQNPSEQFEQNPPGQYYQKFSEESDQNPGQYYQNSPGQYYQNNGGCCGGCVFPIEWPSWMRDCCCGDFNGGNNDHDKNDGDKNDGTTEDPSNVENETTEPDAPNDNKEPPSLRIRLHDTDHADYPSMYNNINSYNNPTPFPYLMSPQSGFNNYHQKKKRDIESSIPKQNNENTGPLLNRRNITTGIDKTGEGCTKYEKQTNGPREKFAKHKKHYNQHRVAPKINIIGDALTSNIYPPHIKTINGQHLPNSIKNLLRKMNRKHRRIAKVTHGNDTNSNI